MWPGGLETTDPDLVAFIQGQKKTFDDATAKQTAASNSLSDLSAKVDAATTAYSDARVASALAAQNVQVAQATYDQVVARDGKAVVDPSTTPAPGTDLSGDHAQGGDAAENGDPAEHKDATKDPQKQDKKELPQTGDNTAVVASFVLAASLGLASVAALMRHREQN